MFILGLIATWTHYKSNESKKVNDKFQICPTSSVKDTVPASEPGKKVSPLR